MKKIAAVITSAALLLSATSCSMIVKNDEEQFDYPVTVGNLIIDEAPQNVAVISANLADVVLACAYEGKLAARGDACDQGALEILPSVGTAEALDFHELEDLGIDLILADTTFDEETQEHLDKLGIASLIMKPADDIDSLSKLYSNVSASLAGGYTGKMQAMTVFEELKSTLEIIKSNASSDNIVATTCYIYDITEDECTVAYGGDFANQLFEYASLTNITAADDDGIVGIDTLLKGNPDSIFCDKGVYEKLSKNKDLKSLRALTKGTVYELPKRYLEMQGETCIRTADFIATKTHSGYTQTQQWPDELTEEKKTEYIPPFEPQIDIYYTVGESYEPIKAIEERLIGLGYMEGKADTTFGDDTADAISAFQSANGLSVTGIADYATLKLLLSSDAKSRAEAGEVTVKLDDEGAENTENADGE